MFHTHKINNFLRSKMSNQNPTENLIIYTFNNKILIRKRVNDAIGKSYVLCNDYHKCLTYTFHRGNLYYSYINTSMELTIRRTFDFNTIFLMENVYISPAFSPILISFNNNLMIFYTIKKEDHIHLKCICPLNHDLNINLDVLPAMDSSPLFICHTSNLLYIELISNSKPCIYSLNSNFALNKLITEHQQMPIKKDDTYSALLEEKEKQIQNQKNIIDSISRQYNELMDVAMQYKKEATRWHEKFMN